MMQDLLAVAKAGGKHVGRNAGEVIEIFCNVSLMLFILRITRL